MKKKKWFDTFEIVENIMNFDTMNVHFELGHRIATF